MLISIIHQANHTFSFSILSTTRFLAAVSVIDLSFSSAPTKKESKDTIIGIDLGSTYTCVGAFKNHRFQIINNDQGNSITPSYVAFLDNGEYVVGEAAKNQVIINPKNTISDVKRLIGRKFSDKSVQADKKLVPYSIVSDANDKPMIQTLVAGKYTKYAPEEISAMVLSKIRATAEKILCKEIKNAVIAVPAYFNDRQRQATKDAAIISGIKVEQIINEPIAAAIAYGMDKREGELNLLVFDLGGKTLDVTLLSIDDGVFEVLAINGDTHLGGEDFDQRVMQYFIKMIKQKHNIDVLSDMRALQKLKKEVERAKHTLSSREQFRLNIENLAKGYDFSEILTRARFEALNDDLFKKMLGPVEGVLNDAKKDKKEIDEIVLVGGSTHIPKVQQIISEYFGAKQLSKGIHPELAVAYGAAVHGGIVSEETENFMCHGETALSSGIETVGGVMNKLINRETAFPARKSQMFSTYSDNQSNVLVQVYEGERSMTKDNHFLSKFELIGIPPAPRGVPQIEVSFELDGHGILHVSAEDKGTGKKEQIIITAEKGRLGYEEIDRLVKEAKTYEEEDKLVKERIDSRNRLESHLFYLKYLLDDDDKVVTDKLSSGEKKKTKDMIDETWNWLEDNSKAGKEDYDMKLKEVKNIANLNRRNVYVDEGTGSDDDLKMISGIMSL